MQTPGKPRVLDAVFVMGAPSVAGLPPEGPPELAVVGRSNVGKSSLLNMLTGKRGLARVSSTPGATRQLNVFDVTLAMGATHRKMRVVDLPGYGWARLAKTEKAKLSTELKAYASTRRGRRAVALLLDARREEPSPHDVAMYNLLKANEVPTLLVVTKVDKLGRNTRAAALARLARALGDPHKPVGTSSVDGLGRLEVWSRAWVLLGLPMRSDPTGEA